MEEVRYVDIAGSRMHELPPLLVRKVPEDTQPREVLVNAAAEIVESEDLLPVESLHPEERRLDLALHLIDQYFGLLSHWKWGDSVLEWIRQCEITFEASDTLRPLLQKQVWPHAGRSSFVELLVRKQVDTHGIGLQTAVGTRLTFRQPPPIGCCSNQFLFYLKSSMADAAYRTWSCMNADNAGHFPPNRFHFEVLEM
jgi:hypothetical protein